MRVSQATVSFRHSSHFSTSPGPALRTSCAGGMPSPPMESDKSVMRYIPVRLLCKMLVAPVYVFIRLMQSVSQNPHLAFAPFGLVEGKSGTIRKLKNGLRLSDDL